MHGSIICYLITSISLLPLYGVYFILIYCFNDFYFICGLESLSEYVKISIISGAYKLLITNLSYFQMLSCFFLYFSVNPLIPKSDQHLISPFSIIPESNIKVMRIKEVIINWKTSWLLNKFPLLGHRDCIENSMENMHTDVRV